LGGNFNEHDIFVADDSHDCGPVNNNDHRRHHESLGIVFPRAGYTDNDDNAGTTGYAEYTSGAGFLHI